MMRRIVVFQTGWLLCGLLLLLAASSAALHARPADDPAVSAVPVLAIADEVPASAGGTVQVPMSFTSDGSAIAALTFVIEYDTTWLTFNPTDANGDGIPDALGFSLPVGFSASVPDIDPTAGTISIFVGDTTAPLAALPDGVIATLTFDVGNPSSATSTVVGFASTPAVSFGSTAGESVPGIAESGSVQISVVTPPPSSRPALSIGTHAATGGGTVQVPVTFAADDAQVAAVAFVIDYDEAWLTLDQTDANGDNIPDALSLSLPVGFSATVPQVNPTTGTVMILVGDLMPPLASLPDGALLTLTFGVNNPQTNASAVIGFASTPAVSFGTTTGTSLAGTASGGAVQIAPGNVPPPVTSDYTLYLPLISR